MPSGIWLELIEERMSGTENELKEIISIKHRRNKKNTSCKKSGVKIKRPNLRIFAIKEMRYKLKA